MTSAATAPQVIAVDPRHDTRWRQLAQGEQGCLFTSPRWIAAVCDTYGFAVQARVALGSDGEPLGGFAWVPVDDIRGNRLSSLPFCDRADPLTSDVTVWHALAGEAIESGQLLTIRCLDDTAPTADPRLRAVAEAAWHGTPIDAPPDELSRRFSPSVRRNIVNAERNGVRVNACLGQEAVRRYHRMHVLLRKYKYRLLAQPVGFLERIWDEFSADDSIVTFLASVDGDVIAGAIYLVWKDILYYKFGASLGEHLHLRPNDLIHWTAIRWGSERGLRALDWGPSDLDQPGLVAYKRKWASSERRITTLRSGQPVVGSGAGANSVLGELTRLLTEDGVPDDITERAGALLYRYFC